MKIEQAKEAEKVNMYGGLGRVGLDYAKEYSEEEFGDEKPKKEPV